LVSISLDIAPLLEEAGINETSEDLNLAIRDHLGTVFFGQENVFEGDPVINVVELPEGAWELAGLPIDGWQAGIGTPLWIFQGSGLVITVLLSWLGYLTVNRQGRLTQAVQERTEALLEREQQYRSIFEETGDGLVISALDLEIVETNPAACRMLGTNRDELIGIGLTTLIRTEDQEDLVEQLEQVLSGRSAAVTVQAGGWRRDGASLSMELHVSRFSYGGEPHLLSVVRDITERIRAREWLEKRVEQRTRELAALLEVSRTVTATLELEPLLALILDQLARVVQYSGAGIIGIKDGGVRFLGYRGSSLEREVARLEFSPRQIRAWRGIAQDRGWILVEDLWSDEPTAQQIRGLMVPDQREAFHSIRSWLGVPLLVKDNLIGLLHVDHEEPGRFSEQEARLASGIANQAAAAVENARLYGQARQLAVLEERQRLARELHDSVSQALYGIGLGARTAREWLERDPPRAAAPLDYVHSLAQAGLAEMRALIFELRPDSLEREGVVGALEKQAAVLRSRHGLEVATRWDPEPTIPVAVKETLYRIAQEALNNVIKHAQARRVEMGLHAEAGGMRLEIRDDGIGFDASAEFPGHLGLETMRERALALGGRLKIESVLGEGTALEAWVPVQETG
jgi:PAS domain S-box-containing protein